MRQGQKRPLKKQEKSEKLEPPKLLNSERLELKQKQFGKMGAQIFWKDGSLGFGDTEAPPITIGCPRIMWTIIANEAKMGHSSGYINFASK